MNIQKIFLVMSLVFLSGCKFADVSSIEKSTLFRVEKRIDIAASGDNQVWIEVSHNDEPEVWLNGKKVTEDELIQFSPAVNSKGDYAYLQVHNSFSEVEIVLNGVVYNSNKSLINFLALSDDSAFWIEQDAITEYSSICGIHLANKDTKCKQIEGVIGDFIIKDDNLFLVGYLPKTGIFYSKVFSLELDLIFEQSSANSLYLSKLGTLTEVSGKGPAFQLLLSVLEFHRNQRGEMFLNSNDFLGRVGWNQNYRINTVSMLAAITSDKSAQFLLEQQIKSVLDRHDENGLLSSKKYSVDKKTEIKLAVENANFYSAALDAAHLIENTDVKLRLIDHASRFVRYFSSDWFVNSYRFSSCIPVEFDGVVMPFNMQHVIGAVLIKMDRINNTRQYENEIRSLYAKFIDELVHSDGLITWAYWPSEFNGGWTDGAFDSCNNKTRGVNTDTLVEDTWHAVATIEFMDLASSYLGERNPIMVGDLAAKVLYQANRFSFLINGDSRAVAAKWSNLPPLAWAATEAIRPYFEKRVILPFVHFDNQWISASHILAMTEKNAYGEIKATKLLFKDEKFQEFENVEIILDDGLCNIWVSGKRDDKIHCGFNYLDSWVGILNEG